MKNSITYLDEKSIRRIAENIENTAAEFCTCPDSLTEFVLSVKNQVLELGRIIIRETLSGINQTLCDSPDRKEDWLVKKHDTRKVLTSLGEVEFAHTLFEGKNGQGSRYLLDELIGLEPSRRILEDAVANILEEAAATSYRSGGNRACEGEPVSPQTVKNIIHGLAFPQEEKPAFKKAVRFLYIEADEDHIALQFQNRKGDLARDENGRKNNTVAGKIVYVHEGLEKDSPGGKRRHLVNAHYFGGLYSGEENKKLWEEVFQYIEDHYDLDAIEKIYLGADGGTWIQGADSAIPGICMALDEFHLSKYLLKMTAFLQDSAYDARQDLKKTIRENDRKSFDRLVKKTEGYCETESGKKRIAESADYIRSNWEAAMVRLCREDGLVGCSAEGHVSHVFSSRMSSRPMGWSRTGVEKMCRLRVYIKNGGNVLELAKYQKSAGAEDLPEAAGADGLSSSAILRSEKNRHPGVGKYVEAVMAEVSPVIASQCWYKGLMKSFTW